MKPFARASFLALGMTVLSSFLFIDSKLEPLWLIGLAVYLSFLAIGLAIFWDKKSS
jgi:hypothetical protein